MLPSCPSCSPFGDRAERIVDTFTAATYLTDVPGNVVLKLAVPLVSILEMQNLGLET